MPDGLARERRLVLFADYCFGTWDEQTGVVRWVCSWQATPAEVDRHVVVLREAVVAG